MGKWWLFPAKKPLRVGKKQRRVVMPLAPGDAAAPRGRARPVPRPAGLVERLAEISRRQMARHRGEEAPAPRRESLEQEARRLGMHPKGLEMRRAFEKWRGK